MRKSTSTVAYCLLAGALAVFDMAPFVLLLPIQRTDLYTGSGLILLLVLGLAVMLRAYKLTDYRRRVLFIALFIGAVLNVLTTVLMRTLPPSFLNSLISGSIASLFGLDGEYAYIAAGYEVWCEIWLVLALAICAIAWSVRRGLKARAQ